MTRLNPFETLREAFSLIDGLPDGVADFRGPVPEELLGRAEAALGLRLPGSYRSFVLRYGQGSVGGYEFLGLIPSQAEPTETAWNLVARTLGNREFGLPGTMVTFYNLGNGEDYVLDTAASAEPLVLAWSPRVEGDRSRMNVIHQDFPNFLLDMVRDAIEEASAGS